MSNNFFDFDKFQEQIFQFCKKRKFDEARNHCLEALSSCSDNPARSYFYSKIGYIENAAGNSTAGIEALRTARKLDPNNRGAVDALMCAYVETRSYEDAAQTATDLIDLDTKFPRRSFTSSAYFHKAYAYWNLKKYPEAELALHNCNEEEAIWIAGDLLSKPQLLVNILNRRPPHFVSK